MIKNDKIHLAQNLTSYEGRPQRVHGIRKVININNLNSGPQTKTLCLYVGSIYKRSRVLNIYKGKPKIPVGKWNGSRHSVWGASKNMDCENSEMAYYTNYRKKAQCNHNGKHECSLGPGSAVGEKGKKREQIVRGKGRRHPFPSVFRPRTLFFPSSPNAEPGPRLAWMQIMYFNVDTGGRNVQQDA